MLQVSHRLLKSKLLCASVWVVMGSLWNQCLILIRLRITSLLHGLYVWVLSTQTTPLPASFRPWDSNSDSNPTSGLSDPTPILRVNNTLGHPGKYLLRLKVLGPDRLNLSRTLDPSVGCPKQTPDKRQETWSLILLTSLLSLVSHSVPMKLTSFGPLPRMTKGSHSYRSGWSGLGSFSSGSDQSEYRKN